MWPILLAVYALSSCHGFLGAVSIGIGVSSSISADVWMAHSVSPIWSGSFFVLTAATGAICAKKRTVYLIMCFGAFSVVSSVVAVVSIQLLRTGLVNHMSDGFFLKKEEQDVQVILAITMAGAEIIVCIISAVVSCQVADRAKEEIHKKNEGTFSVMVLGEKDIVIKPTKQASASYERLSEHQISSSDSSGQNISPAADRHDSATEAMIPKNKTPQT